MECQFTTLVESGIDHWIALFTPTNWKIVKLLVRKNSPQEDMNTQMGNSVDCFLFLLLIQENCSSYWTKNLLKVKMHFE